MVTWEQFIVHFIDPVVAAAVVVVDIVDRPENEDRIAQQTEGSVAHDRMNRAGHGVLGPVADRDNNDVDGLVVRASSTGNVETQHFPARSRFQSASPHPHLAIAVVDQCKLGTEAIEG